MTIVSETEHVQVFKINIKISRMKHSAGGIGCAVTSWNSIHTIRLALLEVVERYRCRTFSEQWFRRPALARTVRVVLAMEIVESSRGRREKSLEQEYLKQVLE